MGVKPPVRPLAGAKADFGGAPQPGNPAPPGLGLHQAVRPPGHQKRRPADGAGHPVKLRWRKGAGQGGGVGCRPGAETARIKAAKHTARLRQMPGRAQHVGPILPTHPQQPDSP